MNVLGLACSPLLGTKMKVKMIGGSVLEIITFHEIEEPMITMVEEEEEVLIDTVNVSQLH
jgi:hypothetical protein